MTNLTVQPQRVPLGSFKAPNGSEVPVYITQPWFRALNQLINSVPSPTPAPTGGVTFDSSPSFEYGDIVYSSTDTQLKRLRSTELGDVLYNSGPGIAPFWGPLPTPAPAPDAQLVLYALTGEALLTLGGRELQTL